MQDQRDGEKRRALFWPRASQHVRPQEGRRGEGVLADEADQRRERVLQGRALLHPAEADAPDPPLESSHRIAPPDGDLHVPTALQGRDTSASTTARRTKAVQLMSTFSTSLSTFHST